MLDQNFISSILQSEIVDTDDPGKIFLSRHLQSMQNDFREWKVIFLDVDGVLNNRSHIENTGCTAIGEEFLDRLRSIVVATDADIVLSSSWRLGKDNRRLVRNALASKGMRFIGRTKEIQIKMSYWTPRVVEIKEWLDRHPGVVKFAILDDNSDAGFTAADSIIDEVDLRHSFFKTTFEHGLTDEITKNVIKHLGAKDEAILENNK